MRMKKQNLIPIGIIALLTILIILSGVVLYKNNFTQNTPPQTPVKKSLSRKEQRRLKKEEKKKAQQEAKEKKQAERKRTKVQDIPQPPQEIIQPQKQQKPHLSVKNVSYQYPESKKYTKFNDQFENSYEPINPLPRNQQGGIASQLFFSVDANTFLTGGSNLALLNSNHDFDTYLYTQSLIDLSLQLHTPKEQTVKPIDFKFTGRINTIFGNSGEITTTSEEFVKIGRAVTETKHTHTIDRPLIWAKEAWIKISSESENIQCKTGLFSKKIGLGLILGDGYKTGNPALINNTENFIDQYRPGIEFQLTTNNQLLRLTGYYGMNLTTSSNIENQAAFSNGQELSGDQAPYTRVSPSPGKLQNNFIAALELDFSPNKKNCDKNYDLNFKPFLLFNKDNKQHVEFEGDATSNLWTVGLCLNAEKDRFECNLEFGLNFGNQNVKAWDRNVVEEHARLTQTHLFARTYGMIDNPSSAISDAIDSSGDWELSPAFPWPSEENRGLQFDGGIEYRDENPTLVNNDFLMPPNSGGAEVDMNHIFKNSYSRFRKAYTNNYKGWMLALDMSFKFNDKLKLGFISGVASGDENPNDSSEKAFLYRLDSTWETIRQDNTNHDYAGFNGIQSLYSSKNVPSLFLLQAHKLNRPLSQGPNITNPTFSNLGYLGIGLHYENKNSDRTIKFNPNLLFFATPSSVKFGYDPTVYDIFTTFLLQTDSTNYERFSSHDKTLSSMLGVELNMNFDFMAKDILRFYATGGIFIPGSYYSDIKNLSYKNQGQNIPLKNQLQLSKLDVTGAENVDFYTTTLLDNTAWYVKIGMEFNFDTQTTLFHKKRKKHRK